VKLLPASLALQVPAARLAVWAGCATGFPSRSSPGLVIWIFVTTRHRRLRPCNDHRSARLSASSVLRFSLHPLRLFLDGPPTRNLAHLLVAFFTYDTMAAAFR
jgi:hypothetical protein